MQISGPPKLVVLLFAVLLKIIAITGFVKGPRSSVALSTNILRMSSSYKITTYNVLSSHLSEATHFTACNPTWLDPSYRLNALKVKLDKEVQDNAIVCLQEVSHQWAGVLHTYFAERGYHLVTACYGQKFNGYMGVAIAVPVSKFDLVDVDITRIADTKRFQRKPKPGYVQNIFNYVSKFFVGLGIRLGALQPRFDFWDNVTYRTNQMISMRLKEKTDGKPFVVGTYHMPCMFKRPAVMVTHCALSAQHIAKFAKSDPYVYCGDFNIKPGSSMYNLLTQSTIDAKHEDYPEVQEGDAWTPNLKAPLGSAYVTATGAEPDFTNYAKVQNEPIFCETLDYIFHSSGWKVDAVEALPVRDTVPGPFPNEQEPSDHILISATMSLADK